LIAHKQTKHQKPKMKNKERKGNKQANKQHQKKEKSDSVYFPLYPVDKLGQVLF
jgi:hypothetical protein